MAAAASSKKRVVVQPSPRVIANRKNGQKGGLATAKKYDRDWLQARAAKGGQATRDRYGKDYYRWQLNSRRLTQKQEEGPRASA